MGQYYQCLVKRGDTFKNYSLQIKGWKEKEKEGDTWAYNGIKLLEHSYWRNSFMVEITGDLYRHKARVAWVGDYADDYNWEHPEDKPVPKALHWLAWGGVGEDPILPSEDIEEGGDMVLDDKYLVNHTKKIYVDCNKYYDLNKFKWSEEDKYTCIHPLSLLTACGNGLGGGDYHEDNPDYWRVGEWCFDEISVEDEPPVGYHEENYCFKEN